MSDVDLLSDAVRSVCALPLGGVPEASDELGLLRRAIDMLEVRCSRLAKVVADSDLYDALGFTTPIASMTHNYKMSGHAAAERVCVGEQADVLPRSIEALERGELGFGHLAVLAHTARALADSPTALPFDESMLLDQARTSSVGQLRHLCHHLRHSLDPERYAQDEAAAAEFRELVLTAMEDGAYFLQGTFDSVGGALIRTALEPLARKNGQEDHRLRAQRMADALVELANHGLDSGVIPQRAGVRPHVNLNVPIETLTREPGAPGGEMEFALPISYKTIERLTCDATMSRILTAKSVPIDVGRAVRTITPAQRRALRARGTGCEWPKCDRPASWTSGHHYVHWSKGGGSDLDNLGPYCYRHHWMLHEGGWQVVKTADGEVIPIPPEARSAVLARPPAEASVS